MLEDPETLCPKHFSLSLLFHSLWGSWPVLFIPLGNCILWFLEGLWKKTTRSSPDFTDEVTKGQGGEGAFSEPGS